MQSTVEFVLDGQHVRLDFPQRKFPQPTTTLLQFLRSLPGHRGVKEGCAEGDCGACTVVLAEPADHHALRYRAVDSCLVFLPMIHGRQVITIENLKGASGELHPVQRAIVDHYGSQCGFCTPGVVMSLFAIFKSSTAPSRAEIVDAVAGNLCRCTGYRSIIDAGLAACGDGMNDHFSVTSDAVFAQLKGIPQDGLAIDNGEQRYYRPATLAQALEARAQIPDAQVICGATDVALRVTKKHEMLRAILDISGIAGLQTIEDMEDGLRIGAAATVQEVLESSRRGYPPLAEMLGQFGSRQIRSMATLGGNVGTASPIGDTLPVLVAMRGVIELTSMAGVRQVPVEEMILGYRTTACRADELITRIFIPRIPRGVVVRSYKVARRRDLDISTVSGAFRLSTDPSGMVRESVLAFGGMSGMTRRATRTEAFLAGRPWTRQAVEGAMDILATEFAPLSDVRGSATFRTTVARNLLLKFWDDTSTIRTTAEAAV